MNVYACLKKLSDQEESFTTLFNKQNVKVELIQSNMPHAGEWYQQKHDEWLILLEGEASLEYTKDKVHTLIKGDTLLIPANKKHRVAYTSKNTLWLTIHLL